MFAFAVVGVDDHPGLAARGSKAPVIHRPSEQLRARLAFGPAEAVLQKLAAFRDAGVQRTFMWPVADDIEQLKRFGDEVIAPLQA